MSTSFRHGHDIDYFRFLRKKPSFPINGQHEVLGCRVALPPDKHFDRKSSATACFTRFSIRQAEKTPVRRLSMMPAWFERVAAAFEEASHVGLGPCSETPADLSELDEWFLEVVDGREDIKKVAEEETDDSSSSYTETACRLRGMLRHDRQKMRGDAVSDDVRRGICMEVEAACVILVGDASSDDFKRRMMSRLRERGFDAGFCKSKWEKASGFSRGEYSFVDVDVNGVRYIVEVDLSMQFEMARCTEQYRQLLDMIPPVFVGREDKLKQLVRIMCSAQKRSMKKMDLHIPPWRRQTYMMSKWFEPQDRTTTGCVRARVEPQGDVFSSYDCREDFSGKNGLWISYSNLGAAPGRKKMMWEESIALDCSRD